MNREEKRNIRLKIIKLLDSKCKGCDHHFGNSTHVYCSNECSIGKSLLMYSKQLIGEEPTLELTEDIKRPDPFNRGPWNLEEEFYLLNHMELFNTMHLATRLNRSPTSVSAKMNALKRKYQVSVSY